MFLAQNKPVLKAKEIRVGMKVKRITEANQQRNRDFLVSGVVVSKPYRNTANTGSTQYYVDVKCDDTGKIFSVYTARLTRGDDVDQ